MKNKLFLMLAVIFISVTVMACGNDSTSTETSIDNTGKPKLSEGISDTLVEPTQKESDNTSVEKQMEAEAADISEQTNTDNDISKSNETYVEEKTEQAVQEDSNDPIGLLEISNNDVQNLISINPITTLVLARNGKYYSLNKITVDKAQNNNVGVCMYLKDKYASLYAINQSGWDYEYVSMGDIPVPVIEPGDELRMYSSSTSSVVFFPAAFEGYTLRLYNGKTLVTDCFNGTTLESNAVIEDSTGNQIATLYDSINNLDYGKEYIVSWSKGTSLNTIETVADSRAYTANSGHITLEGKPTKEGYAIIDLSALEPGIYETEGGLIEIK